MPAGVQWIIGMMRFDPAQNPVECLTKIISELKVNLTGNYIIRATVTSVIRQQNELDEASNIPIFIHKIC